MYFYHYDLDEEPFQLTPNPKYAWLGEKHAEALATLEYAIQENKGFLVLTGDVGTGKTLMINCLLKKIGEDVIAVKVPNPGMEAIDFFNFLSAKFGWKKNFKTKGKFLLYLEDYLYQLNSEDKRVLLIIDEAQELDNQLIEEIRLLSNIELEYKKLIDIFFVGQNELINLLRLDKNKALRERIAIWCNIEPLSEMETAQYISYRLSIAGAGKDIFQQEAIRDIHLYSKGIPRKINILCDQALLTGFSLNIKEIEANIIQKSAIDLGFQFQKSKIEKPQTDRLEFEPSPIQGAPGQEEIAQIQNAPGKEDIAQTHIAPRKRPINQYHLAAALILVLIFIVTVLSYHSRSLTVEEQNAKAIKTYDKKQLSRLKEQPDLPAGTQTPASETNQIKNLDKNDKTVITKIENRMQTQEEQPLPSEEDQVSAQDITSGIQPRQTFLAAKKTTVMNEGIAPDEKVNAPRLSPAVKYIKDPFQGTKLVVYFKYNSNELLDEEFAKLDTVAEYMKYKPDIKINVKGYTDNLGSAQHNRFISRLRAINVKTYLISKELDTSRIKVFGLGQKNPIANNQTKEGRRLNRRVELELAAGN
jgi:general secretion pathway protein A